MASLSSAHGALVAALAFAACAGADDLGAGGLNLDWGTAAYERDPSLDVENTSSAGLQISHNEGDNCVRCHQEYGPGLGRFTLAGSVADPSGQWLENPVVELWSAPEDRGGERVLRLEGDARGNFYTTEELPLPAQPLFVKVLESSGTRQASMPFPIANGSCNHCHAGGFRVSLEERGAPASE